MSKKFRKLTVTLKIIGKEFQKICYKTIFRKINREEIFSNLQSLQIKTIFQEKKLDLQKFTVAVYVIYRISVVLTSFIGANCEYCL